MDQGPWAIGVDLGGTKTELARVNADGQIEQRILLKTNVNAGPSAVTADIIAAAKELRRTAAVPPAVIGVAVAGQVNEERGIVRFAPNLAWQDVPLGEILSEALDLRVSVMNDVRAATCGEWLQGAGRGCDDLICVFVGTGIGGGVVSGGRMLRGCSNTAGEIGHMTIDIHGPPCTCRNSGCLEALAGGWAIARSAQDAVKDDPAAGAYLLSLADGMLDHVSAKIVGQAMHEGDPLAVRLMNEVASALSAGAVALVNAFNPCRLILGGGVMEGVPELVDGVREGIFRSALATAIDRLEVLRAELRHDAGAVGIASYALRSVAAESNDRSAA